MTVDRTTARAVADVPGALALATVELPVPPARVFEALTSPQIVEWWVRPGVFDTRDWSGEVRVGGSWRASGVGGGRPYVLEGEFVEVDRPRRLVHTWRLVGVPGATSTATYLLDEVEGGTRITFRQSGFGSADTCIATAIGWETSFARLRQLLSDQKE
ncbi:MAG TPA: SRPBCC family protein [Candidatus Limnocylindrales bacterium]|nr:SRPBCC family protein [Candidatus Limnocylindrales bacterium]